MIWKLAQPLTITEQAIEEHWIREGLAFPVTTRFGKKTNLLRLKKEIIETLKKQVAYYNESRRSLFEAEDLEVVGECMVCGAKASDSTPKAEVYGATFSQCPECTHVFRSAGPTKEAVEEFYRTDTHYAATYTSREVSEFRVESIALPWVDWMVGTFKAKTGRSPRNIVDVGSGGGHFVEGCRRRGLNATGIEISDASCAFARETWGFEQDQRDFAEVAKEYAGADIVTFWGMLEHTPNPLEILSRSMDVFAGNREGMVVAKLPRWSCLSAAVQTLTPDTIVRHLDPLGHAMIFTDASAAELFYRAGFRPAAAWYFGMDVYETIMQFCHQVDQYDVLTKTGELQVDLQQKIDEARFSDNFVLAGFPGVSS